MLFEIRVEGELVLGQSPPEELGVPSLVVPFGDRTQFECGLIGNHAAIFRGFEDRFPSFGVNNFRGWGVERQLHNRGKRINGSGRNCDFEAFTGLLKGDLRAAVNFGVEDAGFQTFEFQDVALGQAPDVQIDRFATMDTAAPLAGDPRASAGSIDSLPIFFHPASHGIECGDLVGSKCPAPLWAPAQKHIPISAEGCHQHVHELLR